MLSPANRSDRKQSSAVIPRRTCPALRCRRARAPPSCRADLRKRHEPVIAPRAHLLRRKDCVVGGQWATRLRCRRRPPGSANSRVRFPLAPAVLRASRDSRELNERYSGVASRRSRSATVPSAAPPRCDHASALCVLQSPAYFRHASPPAMAKRFTWNGVIERRFHGIGTYIRTQHRSRSA